MQISNSITNNNVVNLSHLNQRMQNPNRQQSNNTNLAQNRSEVDVRISSLSRKKLALMQNGITQQNAQPLEYFSSGISLDASECFAAPWARIATHNTWQTTGCPHIDSLASFWVTVGIGSGEVVRTEGVFGITAHYDAVREAIPGLNSRTSELSLHLLSSIITSNEPKLGAGFHTFGNCNMWWGIDMNNQKENLAALANKYLELRESLKSEFSGEALDEQLQLLSDAFELASTIYADAVANWADRRMFNIAAEAGLLNTDVIINNQEIPDATDRQEHDRFRAMIINGIRETTKDFTHQFRQFVLEHGAIDSERQLQLLTAFFENDEREGEQLSFGQFTRITQILAESRDDMLANNMFNEINNIVA